ncbi:hypothetical protein VPHK356_0111 [Vibrio phage K356]|nr:hypothetical protein MYOV002v2_p0103 [Vibrio phage 144E46.1]
MKQVTGYLADNGKFFEEETECAKYEQYINLRKIIASARPQDHGIKNTGNAHENLTKFIEELIEGYPEAVMAIAERSLLPPQPAVEMPSLDQLTETKPEPEVVMAVEAEAEALPPFEPTHTIISSGERVVLRFRHGETRAEVESVDRAKVECIDGDIKTVPYSDLKRIPSHSAEEAITAFEPTHTIISSGERVMYRGVIDGDRSEVECVSGNIIAVQALDLKPIPNPKLKKWLNQPA